MKDKESKPGANHIQKGFVAAGETAIFALAGLVFPPAHIGWVVTAAENFRQNYLVIRDTEKKLKLLEKEVYQLGQRVEEHICSDHDDEQIEPDPKTATPEEIERHKKKVWNQAFQPPRKK